MLKILTNFNTILSTSATKPKGRNDLRHKHKKLKTELNLGMGSWEPIIFRCCENVRGRGDGSGSCSFAGGGSGSSLCRRLVAWKENVGAAGCCGGWRWRAEGFGGGGKGGATGLVPGRRWFRVVGCSAAAIGSPEREKRAAAMAVGVHDGDGGSRLERKGKWPALTAVGGGDMTAFREKR